MAESKRSLARLHAAVRQAAGYSGKCYPVVEVEGCGAPQLAGKKWHHVNATGDVISFPNAYRRAWGKPRYVGSTLRIEVGRLWVEALRRLGTDCPASVVSDLAYDLEGVLR